MGNQVIRYNERAWAGQIIGWIKIAIETGSTVFQEVSNDTSVKMKSGKTLFPDILLFTDKVSGIVFNGWELKFPDTAVDDEAMLLNALDLNANFIKETRFLNPDLLNEAQKQEILSKFEVIENRTILEIFDEVKQEDRIEFDKTVMRCYGLNENMLDVIYTMLTDAVHARTSLRKTS